ncbi:CHRD domain-containing protein [Paludibacterium yongneupense]|uniref:CHRD domain-containing protein n=1 Tax=Paludibacterium yongneupense TaxID=400061 RepID=UPI00048D8CB2|nr:CHRD domain-containing protein [Paludibacterium yongneupense]
MNRFQIVPPAAMRRIALCALALSALSTLASADELKFRLSGAMEVPPVTTIATGNADITVNKDMTVSGHIATSGISGTMAHIHRGKAGSNGPVIVTLTKSGDDGWMVPTGTKLDEADFKAFMADGLYVNVHSAENKGGEIRGQLMPSMPMMNSQ